MKKLAIAGLITTQLLAGFSSAANLDACEPLTTAMAGNSQLLDKIFGLNSVVTAASDFYSKLLAISKKSGLHAKAQELVSYRASRDQVFEIGQKYVSQVSDADLTRYLQLKTQAPKDLEFKLQDEIKAALAAALLSLKPEITNLEAQGYTLEVVPYYVGTVAIKKQIADSKAINYSTNGWSIGGCSHSRSHTQVVLQYIAGQTSYKKMLDRPNTQGCNQTDLGYALANLSKIELPESCNSKELNDSFTVVPLE